MLEVIACMCLAIFNLCNIFFCILCVYLFCVFSELAILQRSAYCKYDLISDICCSQSTHLPMLYQKVCIMINGTREMYILHINHIMMSAPCNYFVNVNVHICLLHIYLCLHLLRCHCRHLICQLIWNLEDTRGPNYLDPRNSVTSFLHQCLLYPWQYSHYRDELDAHNPQSAHYNLS